MNGRTIIDILRKGNQEQFHSSMVAWLLDPHGEHGYGAGFLHGFADFVGQRGDPRFRSALQGDAKVTITTEAAARQSRHDIRLGIGGTTVVIENKTKSLGGGPQFDKYKAEGTVLVALGLCDLSFSEGVRGQYPLLTYGDVLSLLEALPEPPASDFIVLVDHYRRFLRRELGLLSEIDGWHATGDPAQAVAIREQADASRLNDNDRRFLNYYLLERLRRDLLRHPRWGHCEPKMDKNMQSGVWLALFGLEKEGCGFRYADALAALWREQGASVWFHIELREGVLAPHDDSTAGVIQLRCHAKEVRKVVEAFSKVSQPQAEDRYPASVKEKANTFFLTQRPLLKKHLTAGRFTAQVEAFAASFGSFTGP